MESASLQGPSCSSDQGDSPFASEEEITTYMADIDRGNEKSENDNRQSESGSDSESDNGDLAEIPSIFGTSVARVELFTQTKAQIRDTHPITLHSMRPPTTSFQSRQSFASAHSSLASYVTAKTTQSAATASSTLGSYLTRPDIVGMTRINLARPIDELKSKGVPIAGGGWADWKDWPEFKRLTEAIERRSTQRAETSSLFDRSQEEINKLKETIYGILVSRLDQGSKVTSLQPVIQDIADNIKCFEQGHIMAPDLDIDVIRLDVAVDVYMYALTTRYLKHLVPSGMFTDGKMSNSDWLMHLHSRGILPDEAVALDWSGRGQHAEYSADEELLIPLVEGKVLGYSTSALVQSVRCRRIQLARKTIRCTRRFTKEMAVTEVQHLQRVQHRHVVRVVGTYTFKKNLAILLYPATRWNLKEFLEEQGYTTHIHNRSSAWNFFGCLSNAMHFIHTQHVKHMDIKPGNILVREVERNYRVYIADFGIARAYKSAEESNTDSPTSFTRIYAAPEVALQFTRGYSADIFSLGCVFLEIHEALSFRNRPKDLVTLESLRTGDKSYQANLEAMMWWCDQFPAQPFEIRGEQADWHSMFKQMLDIKPQNRPSAAYLVHRLRHLTCGSCDTGPEPFEAAD